MSDERRTLLLTGTAKLLWLAVPDEDSYAQAAVEVPKKLSVLPELPGL